MKLLLCSIYFNSFIVAGAGAATISFTGALDTACTLGCQGNTSPAEFAQFSAAVFDFTLAAPTSAYAITFSYGGGVNGNGLAIANGGFEPYLSLFDSSGNFLASTYSGQTCPTGALTYQGACLDVRLDMGVLPAGTYQIAISSYANLSFAENFGAGTLSDGFTGLGSLYSGEDLHFAFDIVTGSDIPEQSTWLLTAVGLVFTWRLRRREPESPR
jgi:hypothetical protein